MTQFVGEFYLIESVERSREGVKHWWKPNELGYTREVTAAGRFTRERAEEILARANRVILAERMWSESEVLNERAGPTEVIVLNCLV